MTDQAIQRIVTALDLAGIPYMLTGSFASVYYGSPRSTQDIDIVIDVSPEQLRKLGTLLPKEEFHFDLEPALEAHRRQSQFNVIDLQTGWKTDLIIRKSRAFSEEEFRRRSLVQVHGSEFYMVSPEDLVIAKLEWANRAQSRRQLEDVAGVLRLHWNSLDHSYIEKWIRDLGLGAEWLQARQVAGLNE